MSFKEYITESKEEINEGFFGDLMDTFKLGSKLSKYAKTVDFADTRQKRSGEVAALIQDAVIGGLKIIDDDPLEMDLKRNFLVSYIKGVDKGLKKASGWSLKEVVNSMDIDKRYHQLIMQSLSGLV